jgi:cytochrome c biogenesis protein CcmG, thiol:disulfide interchange protein DsbE
MSAEETAPALAPRPPARATRIALLIAVAAALVALLWPRGDLEAKRRPGGFLVDEGGRPVPLARELRAVSLVHFWATWCPPCLVELPELVELGRDWESERFGVVLIAVADEPEAARRFVGTRDLPLLFDPGWEVAHRFSTRQLPETHVVVAGEVVESFVGAQRWSDPAVRSRVQKWMATPASAAP